MVDNQDVDAPAHDRQAMGGDALPMASAEERLATQKNWMLALWVGGSSAVIAAILGLMIGYAEFHHGGAGGAQKAGKPSGANLDSVFARRPPPATAQQQQLAGMVAPPASDGLCPKLAPGTPHDVNCNPLPGGQAIGSAPAAVSQPHTTQAQTIAAAARRSPIMAFAGGSEALAAGSQTSGRTPPFDGAGAEAYPGEAGDGGRNAGGADARAATTAPPGSGFGFVNQRGDGDKPTSSDFSGELAHSAIQTVRATLVANRSFLLSAGTLVPCTLQTAINSTQAGFVSCVINHDVFSEDGRVVLLDKGTKVLGQYAGGIQQGQARLFVVWTRALTPRGVAIDLGSPAADELGRSGMAGGIDSQFWQRFGAALMLSVIEDGMNIAGQSFAAYGSNTTQVPANTASIALQNSISIRPILKKNQGDLASIFVAKDFDFSSVYSVRLRR